MDELQSLPVVIAIAALCFLIGGIPFGFIAGKIAGLDIREHGSKNIGATNVMRVLGRKYGIPVFVGDFLKAFLPVFFLQETTAVPWQVILYGLMVILGHTFCPYLGFKGGKGVASSAGFVGALMPWALAGCLALWGAVFYGSRYVSLASLAAAVALPVAAFASLRWQDAPRADLQWYTGLALFLCFMVIWT
ncbi:MAG: glycerol-3-phosphate 1-O-acyltransferase PlsY, partial [Verrucomicrobiales bacterium]|nr:glycerol-3-phosphate 1-O-acyltransferase PlsY [Verrucomicrobiales bacterium]